MRLLIIFAALAFVNAQLGAETNSTTDGNHMLSMCEHVFDRNLSDLEAANSSVCLVFVHASYYTALLVRDFAQTSKLNFCGKPGLTNGQLARIFVRWLRAHPERLNEPAAFLAYEAWESAYPCRAAPKK